MTKDQVALVRRHGQRGAPQLGQHGERLVLRYCTRISIFKIYQYNIIWVKNQKCIYTYIYTYWFQQVENIAKTAAYSAAYSAGPEDAEDSQEEKLKIESDGSKSFQFYCS